MRHIEIITRDNYKLQGTLFESTTEPKAIFYMVHGMCEHKERFYKFMEFLSKHGYTSLLCDLRGHGIDIEKSELGYFGTKDSLINDLEDVIKYIKCSFPYKKIILFGHSMGSLIVRNYIQNNDSEIDKMILCGPPTKNVLAPVGSLLSNTMCIVKGKHYRSKFINGISIGSYNKGFTTPNSWLLFNKDELNKYNNDKYCGFIFTANGFKTLFYMLKRAYDKSNYKCNNKDIKILVIGGSEDRVIVSQKKFDHLIKFLNKVGYNSVDYKVFNNMRHDILNEKENDKVYEKVLSFINK